MPLLAEMGWGGLVQEPSTISWTDITPYVDMKQGVVITRGASDELSETQPGTGTLRLDNADGRFTPGNSASPYYPFVRRNAPIRISAAVIPTRSGSAPYPLAMLGDDFDDNRVNTALWSSNFGGASETGGRMRVPVTTAGTAGFQTSREWILTGSKLQAKLVTLPGANGSSAAFASMWVNSTTSGTRLGWRYYPLTGVLAAENQAGFFDGSPVNLTYSAIAHRYVRIRESGGTVYWETSGNGFGWTTRRTLATPAWVTSQTLAVEFPTSRTGGTNDFVEWDLVGAEIRPRYYGIVNEFPVEWEGLSSTVTISATDLFKRLNRIPPLKSMLVEEVIQHGPLVYYPLTEPDGSTTAGDLSGAAVTPLAISQAGSGGTLTMAGATGPPETGEQSPLFTPVSATVGKWLSADLGTDIQEQLTGNRMVMEAWFQTTTGGRAIVGIASPDLQYQHILSLTAGGTLQIEWTSDAFLQADVITAASGLNDGDWHHVLYDQRTDAVWVDGVFITTTSADWGYNERMLHVGGYRSTRLWNGAVGHAAVYAVTSTDDDTLATHYDAGFSGFSGEAADERVERLARYADVPWLTIWGTTHDPIASQGPAGSTVVQRLREVESTESGRLFAERDWFGLAYQSRDIRYNPDPSSEVFTIAYADLETPSARLADDDQKLVNSIEASRPGGATQRVTAPSSILAFGIYDPGALSILKTTDNSVLDAAYWRVSRYANPGPELREVPIEAFTMSSYLSILDAEISSYFSVTGLPSQAPASSMRVTIEGYTETIKYNSHVIQFHTSASVTDSVWVLGDTTYSVLDSTTRLAY